MNKKTRIKLNQSLKYAPNAISHTHICSRAFFYYIEIVPLHHRRGIVVVVVVAIIIITTLPPSVDSCSMICSSSLPCPALLCPDLICSPFCDSLCSVPCLCLWISVSVCVRVQICAINDRINWKQNITHHYLNTCLNHVHALICAPTKWYHLKNTTIKSPICCYGLNSCIYNIIKSMCVCVSACEYWYSVPFVFTSIKNAIFKIMIITMPLMTTCVCACVRTAYTCEQNQSIRRFDAFSRSVPDFRCAPTKQPNKNQ